MNKRTANYCGQRQLVLAIFKFFVPSHLDGFEFAFVGGRWVTVEAGKFSDPFVHVGKADCERIGVWVFVGQPDGDVFDLVPTELWRHLSSQLKRDGVA